ncbi:protein FAM53A isoform X2 [Mustela lutreola]|uniref:protein FAM53A isoform X2 n=1 Tax=Mustela lutreola TaxID=9666 RepID=UPI0027975C8A|nr:protein FAM53A isoform X2 [Mustela lutreola]
MVTLITEKLQNQSLDDLAHKSYDASPHSAGALSNCGHLFPFESDEDRCPWKVLGGRQPVGSQTVTGTRGPDAGLGAVSTTDLRESTGPPLAPPTKRHCRSLSEPDGLARCRSPWRPGGSKVWTPVSKRRCHSGGSATPQESLGPGPTLPPAPQLPWASSGHTNGCESGPCPPWWRRLSLSQEHLAGLGTALASTSSSRSSTPELGRQLGLLRCRSQPCVLVGRRWRRRREERTRWPRPSLDFLKMTRAYCGTPWGLAAEGALENVWVCNCHYSPRGTASETLKNSKSLCSLDYEDEEEDDSQGKLAPYDPHGLMGVVTPGSSPWSVHPSPHCTGPGPWASWEPVAAEGEGGSGGDPSDGDSAGEEGAFPPGRGELDLGQIESN